MTRSGCLVWVAGAFLLMLSVAALGTSETSEDSCSSNIHLCRSAHRLLKQADSAVVTRSTERNKTTPQVTGEPPSSSEPDLVTLEVIQDTDDPQGSGPSLGGGDRRSANNQQPQQGLPAQNAGDSDGVSLLDIIEGHSDAPESEEEDDDLFPEQVFLGLEGFPPAGPGPDTTGPGSATPTTNGSPGGILPGGARGSLPGGAVQGGVVGGNVQGGVQGGPQRGIPGGGTQGGVLGGNVQGGIQGGVPGGNIQGGIQGVIPGGNIQGGIQGGIPGGNIQGGIQGGVPGSNIQGGIQGGRQGGNIQGGIRTGPTFIDPPGTPGGGGSQGSVGILPGGGSQGGVGTLPGGGSQGGLGSFPPGGGLPSSPPPPVNLTLTAEPIEAPPKGKDAEFFGQVDADLCDCTDAVPSGAFNCMQVRFQNECETPSVLKGPPDVPEGFCQITCGRCKCCTDMLTMSSRRGLDVFRRLFQTMADAQGSRSIGRSLQNPSFATTVFAPTNGAFDRMLHAINMTVDEFLQEPSLMNQIMTYHVLLGPTAASSEELATGFLGTTLPTVNAAAFVSVNATGPTLEVGGIGSFATVIVPDVFSCRSIFHVVDEVLLPFAADGLQGGRLQVLPARLLLKRSHQGGRVAGCIRVRADSLTNEALTDDMRRCIQETQKNMFEINRSRLKAIEDASQERRNSQIKDSKIEELMSKIESLEMENAQMKTQLGNGASQQEVGQDVSAPPVRPAESTPVEEPVSGNKIVIHYASGWSDAFVHYNADKKGWTSSPGLRMGFGSQGRALVVEASAIEFVLNNGQGEWDRPNPFSEKPGNYWIDAPGEYLLKNGRVQRL